MTSADPYLPHDPPGDPHQPPVAIVGMACVFPGARDLEGYWRNIIRGVDATGEGGGLIDRLTHESGSFGEIVSLPSSMVSASMVPAAAGGDTEQGLLRTVIHRALLDARQGRQRHQPASERSDGPASLDSVPAERTQVVGNAACALLAIEQVVRSLRDHRCDLGIAAAIHLVHRPQVGRSLAAIGEGVGAVVFRRFSDAERDGDRIYAVVRGVGVASRGDGAVLAMRRAYQDADLDPQSVTLVEDDAAWDDAWMDALRHMFGRDGYPAVALGSVTSMIGHTMVAAGMAGVIKTALALYHRVLPPTVGGDRTTLGLDRSRLYVNTATRPWISPPDTPRRAGVMSAGVGGIHGHVILEEAPEGSTAESLTPRSSELLLGSAETRADLLERLADWAEAVAHLADEDLRDVAFTASLRFSPGHPFRMAIVATSMADLEAKLTRARDRLGRDTEESWSEADGTHFSAEPRPGNMAFLFPGIGFPGLAGGYTGRLAELCLHFREVRRHIDYADGLTVADGTPYPLRYQFFPPPLLDSASLAGIEKELAWSERTLIGMMTASLATWSLMRSLGFQPDAIAGFSLGEWSALVAAGVLDGEELIRLKEILRAEAGPQGFEVDGAWAMVAAGADQVEVILEQVPGTVSLTMDVSPTQAFIGGEVAAVRAALQRLREEGIWGQELPFPPIHTPLAVRFVERLREVRSILNVQPLVLPVYSGMSGRPYPDDPNRIREVILEGIAAPVRIRDTIRALYADGVRIFVQLGSGGKILTNIQNTLALDPHVALSIDLERRGGLEQFHHLVGRLAVLGVPFAPQALFRDRSCRELDLASGRPAPPPARSLHRMGGPPISPTRSRGVLEESLATLGRFLEIHDQNEQAEAQVLVRYLETQEAAMKAFLAPATTPPRIRYPFVGEILRLIPGRELTSRLTLDLEEHLFLADHAFIRAPASFKPVEGRLPTLPLTVGVEVLAEAAATLVPDLTVLACHDVEASRWISLEDTRTLQIDIAARRMSATEVSVELYTKGKEKPALRGAVSLGEAWIPPPHPMTLRCDQPCPHSADQLYSEGRMFHGPRFQVVSALCGMSEGAIAAELVIRDPQELFATPLEGPLIFDPVLLDGLGQVLGYRAQLDDQTVLPVRIGRIAFHGAAPPLGSTVRTAIHSHKVDGRRLEGDIDVFDAAGRLWLHIDGWQTWRLLWSKRLQEFSWRPEERSLAAPWPLGGQRASCFRIVLHLLGEVDLDQIARTYLAGEEWIRYQQRPRLDWLLGRIAANDAIRDWLRRQYGRNLHPLEVTIANRPGGAPVVAAPADVPLAISISHLDEEAMAVVAQAKGVGVDLVRVVDRGSDFLDLAFDQEERTAIARAGPDAASWAHRAWCAKEAAAKAHALGFDALGQFRVCRVAEDGIVEVEFRSNGQRLNVETHVDQERVMAMALIE